MKFQVERGTLLPALAAARRIALRYSTIPILSSLRLEVANARLQIMAHQLDSCLTAEVDAAIETKGATTVEAEALYGLVSALPAGAHPTFALDRAALVMTHGRSRYRLPTLPAEDFPAVLAVGDRAESVTLARDDVAELLKRGMFAVETDAKTRMYLCGAHLHSYGGVLSSAVTDGKRVFRTAVGVKFAGRGVIVGVPACAEIAHLAGDEIALAWDERIITATGGGVRYASKLIDGEYPDIDERVMRALHYVGYIECDRAELQSALDRIAVTAGAHILMTWDDSLIVITSPEGGREEVACVTHGCKGGTFGVDPGFMCQAIGVVTSELVRLYWIDSASPLKVVDPRQPDLLFIQMPRYVPSNKAAA